MSVVASVGVLVGVAIVVLAAIGLLKFDTVYARLHAAGKASPVAFIVISVGGALEMGGAGAARLLLASVALVLTLPLAVHLMFRAVHSSRSDIDPDTDELREAMFGSSDADDVTDHH